MNDTRLVRLMAALDDARTEAQDLLDEMDSTHPAVLPLKRVLKNSSADLKALDVHCEGPAGVW
jgi:hypothetical protein